MLLDSNIVIYTIDSRYASLRSLVATTNSVSAVTVIEVLGYHKLGPAARRDLELVLSVVDVLPISAAIVDRAVVVRRLKKMSVGDAIIAATALEHGLTLGTNNEGDFAHVPGLRLQNPLKP